MSEARSDAELLRSIAEGDVRALAALREALASEGIVLEAAALGQGPGKDG